jgi:hypothetical protein
VCNSKISRNAQFTGFLRGCKSIDIRAALMAVLHIVLWDRAVVLHILLGEVILRVPLLEQGAALVFLIRQNGLDRAVVPDVVSGGTFDSHLNA